MSNQSSYLRTRERLEEITAQIKAKDIPLEKSLDLYEEALRLGSTCAEMIDRTDFSAEELGMSGNDAKDDAGDGAKIDSVDEADANDDGAIDDSSYDGATDDTDVEKDVESVGITDVPDTSDVTKSERANIDTANN